MFLDWLTKVCSERGYARLGPFRWFPGFYWSFQLKIGRRILFERYRNFEPSFVQYVGFTRDPFAD